MALDDWRSSRAVGNGRMAVMTRLLAAGSFSRTIAEEVGHQKLASEFICRELRDADEANLIDEEDMHVFGLKPMVDPLNLVSCNICKKPVKASQYIIHSELCRSLGSGQGTIMDLDSGMGHRKHSRKEKKKLLPADANISAVEKEGSESTYADYSSAPVFPISNEFEMVKLTKRNSTCTVAPILDDSAGVCHGVVDHSASPIHPSTKRSKLITGEGLLLASDLEPSSSKTKIRNDPFPLASKIYYSQRNNRLRSTLSYLYWEAVSSSKEICNMVDHGMAKENIKQFHSTSQEESQEQSSDIIGKKMDSHSLTSAWKSDRNLAIFSSGKCLPAGGASTKFVTGSSVAWPQIAPVELTQKKLST
ncbi:uncharacterized protein LOC111791619 isoform X2 [Cucurbita pepo subsp. pepo]|uniref:uncharacterized protein LOC111791619 isoform X1 n=1 Tax=Cucurbita pepo subsp. pepo TaxID=3664 RepID=UPI000C9D66B5|nr:uncharacterized protein LOC111791619 isoform X1 [Cucurbita pepo subsp. pepo]XP_023528788.1 uncharacterized protein LOC111791619 isoform X2 [Cucurbita pepo subsp. pepo]